MKPITIVAVLSVFVLSACGPDTNDCINECGPGESRCYGNGVQNCGDINDDGCLEWGEAVSCGSLTCSMGKCTQVCSDLCGFNGETRCDGNGVQTCRDLNSDGCLEWDPTVPCQAGESCANGQCSCSNRCQNPGEKRCLGNGYQECGDFNSDGCLEWSQEIACPEGETCSQGACSSECTDDCQAGGRQCSGDAFRVCGHYDRDDCLDWSGLTNCADFEVCTDGYCAPNCSDECAQSGLKRCYREGFQVCTNNDTDACLEWGEVVPCKAGETCSNGICSSSCTDECSPQGRRECATYYPAASYRQCGEAGDGDNCLDWIISSCPSGNTCSNGNCVPYCTDECPGTGQRRCFGDGYQSCGNYDADSCLEWSGTTPCPSGQSCSNGQCVGSCTDECSPSGVRECVGTAGYRTCGKYDSDTCLDWSGTTSCGTGEICQGQGQCVEGCQNECQLGERGCSTDNRSYWHCQDQDNDGCLDKVYVECAAEQICDDGKCVGGGGTCTDDTYEQNDTLADSKYINEGSFSGLQICQADEDWFHTHLDAGEALDVEITFTHANGDLDVILVDAGNNELDRGDSVDDNETVRAVASTAGNYYIKIYGYSDAENSYGMQITVSSGGTCTDDTYEQNDAQASAAPISSGQFNNLKICPSDADWYAINVDGGSTIQIDITFSHSSGDLDLKLLDSTGNVLDQGTSTTDNETASETVSNSGTYYIHVYGYGGAENSYSMSVDYGGSGTCTDDSYEDNDQLYNAAVVYEGTVGSLKHCANDEDWYYIYLNDGDTLYVDIDFVHASGNLDLKLFSPSETELDSSTSSTDDESVSALAGMSGYYYIQVYGAFGVENSYSMTVSVSGSGSCTDDTYEQNDSLSGAKPISSGSYPSLKICANDEDWFRISADAGDTIEVDIYFTHANGDLDLKVFDSASSEVGSGVSLNDNEQVSLTAATSGYYYIKAYGHLDAENSYSMDVAISGSGSCTDDGYEENDDRVAARYISDSFYSDLQICQDDEDWYKIYLFAGEVITVEIFFSHSGGDLDLRLWDSTQIIDIGNSVTDDELVSYEIIVSNTYYVQVLGIGGVENGYDMDVGINTGGQCTDDSYEENDDMQNSYNVSDSFYSGLQVCSGDQDWYAIWLGDQETITVDINFTHSSGDLDLRLWDSDSIIEYGNSVTDNESVTSTISAPGIYYIQVIGIGGAENGYSMDINIDQGICSDDSYEENDSLAAASSLTLGITAPNYFPGLQVCANDDDYYQAYFYVNEVLEVDIFFTHASGDLDLYLVDGNDQVLVPGESETDDEHVEYTIPTSGYYYIQVRGYQGAENSYDMEIYFY